MYAVLDAMLNIQWKWIHFINKAESMTQIRIFVNFKSMAEN